LLEEIERLNIYDKTPVNKSVVKSFLYSSLLILEMDLVDFYKTKYASVFYNVAVNHAFQENPNTGIILSDNLKAQIISIHREELGYIGLLFNNLDLVLETGENVESKTVDLMNIYLDINQYTSSQINDSLIQMNKSILEIEKTSSSSVSDRLSKDSLPLLKSYKTYYESLKTEVDGNISIYEKQIMSYYDAKNRTSVKLASLDVTYDFLIYAGVMDSFHNTAKSFVSGSVGVISRTVKTISTGVASSVDYMSSKASNSLFSGVDHAQNMWKYGYNSKEYQTWKNEYNKQTELAGGPSVYKTFLVPTLRTALTGKSEESYNKMLTGIGDTMKTGYKGVKTSATLASSNVNYISSQMADFVYGTDTTKSYDEVVLKPTEDAYNTDKTDISLDRAAMPVGLSFALGNIMKNSFEPKKADALLVNDIITPLKDWYAGKDSNVGQESIRTANTLMTSVEEGTADFLGVDTSVSSALLNIATGGLKDLTHGFIKLSDKSVSEDEKVGALFDLCGGLEDMGVDNYLNSTVRKAFKETAEKTALTLKDTLKKYGNDIPSAKKQIALAQERMNKAIAAGKSLDDVQLLEKAMLKEQDTLSKIVSNTNDSMVKNMDNAKSQLYKTDGVDNVIKDASDSIPKQTLTDITEIAEKSNVDKLREYCKKKIYDTSEAQKAMNKAKNDYLEAIKKDQGLERVQSLENDYLEASRNYQKALIEGQNATLDVTVVIPDKVVKLAVDSTSNKVKEQAMESVSQDNKLVSSSSNYEDLKNKPYSTTTVVNKTPETLISKTSQSIREPVKQNVPYNNTYKPQNNTYQPKSTVNKTQVAYNNTKNIQKAGNLIPSDIVKTAILNSIKHEESPGMTLSRYVKGVPPKLLEQAFLDAGSYDVNAFDKALRRLMTQNGLSFSSISLVNPSSVVYPAKVAPKTTVVQKKTPIQVPAICSQATYNWIPKKVCYEAWINSGKNVALFHREVGRLVVKYNIKRP
ncbi:MAG: hypothetical protein AB7V50_04340, partial [Vampirovibrionia bacterium]